MATVDGEQHQVQFRVAVIGETSGPFTQRLNLKDGQLPLGQVQGYQTRLELIDFPGDPWAGDRAAGEKLEKLVPYLDGLILTDAYSEGNHYSSSALEKLRQVLTPGKIRIPAAIFGGQALAEEWASLSGVAPVYSAEPTPNETLPTVKALLKSLLRSQMRSHPPPPPES